MNFKSLSISLILSMTVLGEANALDSNQQLEMVEAHNQYRSEVGISSKVTWSAKLGEMAQAYANKLKNERGCNPIHSQADEVGENLYWASAIRYSTGATEVQQITAKQVADAWGSEKSDYRYSNNSCVSGKVCGHYTQMVWENTTQIGCAKAICADNSQIWVCNYYPAGNYVGQKPY
jgi:Cysteine-rich secretory protein family.